jgi:hypothetical protein
VLQAEGALLNIFEKVQLRVDAELGAEKVVDFTEDCGGNNNDSPLTFHNRAKTPVMTIAPVVDSVDGAGIRN